MMMMTEAMDRFCNNNNGGGGIVIVVVIELGVERANGMTTILSYCLVIQRPTSPNPPSGIRNTH